MPPSKITLGGYRALCNGAMGYFTSIFVCVEMAQMVKAQAILYLDFLYCVECVGVSAGVVEVEEGGQVQEQEQGGGGLTAS